MPSTYAHYRLGQEVSKAVGHEQQAVIQAFPDLFNIGLHGPDILFYYKPLGKNPVNRLGHSMHDRPGAEFFAHAAEVIRAHNGDDAYKSYVYGFLCHFALDVACHGYIEEKIQASGISHAEIEVEFDRELLVRDGLDPIRTKLANHICHESDVASVISDFYDSVSQEETKKALKGMTFYCNFLVAPSKLKRNLIYTGLKLSGNYEGMKGQIVNYEKNPDCADSTEKLIALYEDGKESAITLIQEFDAIVKGELPLGDIYRYTFCSERVEEEVS